MTATNEKPWESAPLFGISDLYDCPGKGWHDGAVSSFTLRWYEGDDRYPANWLCEHCCFLALRLRYGRRSPDFEAAFDRLMDTPTMGEEMTRRYEYGQGLPQERIEWAREGLEQLVEVLSAQEGPDNIAGVLQSLMENHEAVAFLLTRMLHQDSRTLHCD